MAATLSAIPSFSRSGPSFTRPLARGGMQHMSKHFAHPESLPLMLSFGVATVGCYLGLQAMDGSRSTSAEAPAQPWSLKNYRLGLTEKSVDEVLFSINM